jgi:transcriptional regulator with XRE-family HTH domain
MTNKSSIARKNQMQDGDKEFELEVQKRLAELELQQDIIALREDLGLTQTQLADIAGVSQPFIAKLESGRATNIELRTLIRAAIALDAHVEISIRKNPKPRNKTREQRAGTRGVSLTLSATAGRR